MAWVGYRELDAEKTVRPVAWAGHDEGYLERINACRDSGRRASASAHFTNLLTNAVKYSDPGRVVGFEIGCVGAELVCVISDQGIGIPALRQGHGRAFELKTLKAQTLTERKKGVAF